MKPVSAFRTRIAPRVPSIIDPVIDIAVVDAAIEFCEKSLIVRSTLDSFTTSAGVSEYDLPQGTQQSVAKVIRAWCESVELAPVDEDFQTKSGINAQPQFFGEVLPGVVALYDIPDGAYTISVRAAMRPVRSASQLEDTLYEDWIEAIVDGALSRLYLQPGEAFNPGVAAHHEGQFRVRINAALLMANQGRTRVQQFVRPVHI